MTQRSTCIYRVALHLILSLVLINSAPLLAFAQIYVPPDRGLPGRREAGGTRGNCPATATPMVALMPDQNFGRTLEAYPTFYWYIPQIEIDGVEFVLLDPQNNEVYRTLFQLKETPGIISITLPANSDVPPLEVGEDYHWYFSLICNWDDRSNDIYTEGWIQRIAPLTNLPEAMGQDPVPAHSDLYASEGIWFDALKVLADLRQSRPADVEVTHKWTALLQSVGLQAIANEPFLDCCRFSDSEPTASPNQTSVSPNLLTP